MPVTVSVPEKTLEHWCSQYVTYRFRAQAGLWWPSTGADVDVRFLPRTPGKAFQLELKTTTFGAGFHDVKVDLGQLMRYWNGRHATQPFYAFPWPDWYGELEPVAAHYGVDPTSIAFSRSGETWWFADWMVVLTIADVVRALLPEVRRHRAAHAAAGTSEETRGTTARLVRFTPPPGGGRWVPDWGHAGGQAAPQAIDWREFWTWMQNCGAPTWPQLVHLPRSLVSGSPTGLSHDTVRGLLTSAKGLTDEDAGPMIWLESNPEGSFDMFEPVDFGRPTQLRDLPDTSEMASPRHDDEYDIGNSAQASPLKGKQAGSPPLDRPTGPDELLPGTTEDRRQFMFLGARLLV